MDMEYKMTKIQIDNEVITANSTQENEIKTAQNESLDLTNLIAQERLNRKLAFDKFIDLGLPEEVALTISGWVENPTPPREV
jgi:hypothetical protein